MPSEDEPRIRKSVKPETEVRLPPHLDEDHFEIVEHRAPGRYERDSGDRRRDGGYRQQKYAPARIYFYLCIVLLAVCAVEIIALGITIADRQDLQDKYDNLQIENRDLQNKYDRLLGENAAGGKGSEIESNKETPEIDHIDYEDLEKIYSSFHITLVEGLKGGPPTLISVARPDQETLKNLGFDSKKLFIKVVLELNGGFKRSILQETNVSNLGARSEFPIGEINEAGVYEIVVEIMYTGEQPPLTYRVVLHTWTSAPHVILTVITLPYR